MPSLPGVGSSPARQARSADSRQPSTARRGMPGPRPERPHRIRTTTALISRVRHLPKSSFWLQVVRPAIPTVLTGMVMASPASGGLLRGGSPHVRSFRRGRLLLPAQHIRLHAAPQVAAAIQARGAAPTRSRRVATRITAGAEMLSCATPESRAETRPEQRPRGPNTHPRGARHPAARASSSEQNHRSPARASILVFSYQRLPGTW